MWRHNGSCVRVGIIRGVSGDDPSICRAWVVKAVPCIMARFTTIVADYSAHILRVRAVSCVMAWMGTIMTDQFGHIWLLALVVPTLFPVKSGFITVRVGYLVWIRIHIEVKVVDLVL